MTLMNEGITRHIISLDFEETCRKINDARFLQLRENNCKNAKLLLSSILTLRLTDIAVLLCILSRLT